MREKNLGHVEIKPVLREPKFRFEFPLFSRENGQNSEERGIFTNPILSAMAQAFPFLVEDCEKLQKPCVMVMPFGRTIRTRRDLKKISKGLH